jgi:hypothetical protein
MKWINSKEQLPPDGVKVIGWCAQSEFYTAGAVELERLEGRWFEADATPILERFGDESQDPNVFVTHWFAVEPPADVPSPAEMRRALHEDDCQHGIDIDDPCEACSADDDCGQGGGVYDPLRGHSLGLCSFKRYHEGPHSWEPRE